MSTPLWPTTTRGALVGAAVIEESDDTFTLAAHGLVNGQQVTVANLSGGAVNVLVVDAAYFVANATANTFQLRYASGSPVVTFTADGGCDVYLTAGLMEAQTLRNGNAGLIARADGAGGFNARTGLFPGGNEAAQITTSGMTWSTVDLVAAVRHSTGGIYIVPHPAENGSVTAADPSQPRIDALDLQVQDHALDSSGFARGRLVYTAGTPAAVPVEPTATANAERLTTWTVAAGATSTGTPALPRFTTARGGVIPVASSASYPGSGSRYKGLLLYDIALKALVANTNAGATYEILASVDGYKSLRRITTVTRTVNSSTFAAEAVVDTISVPVESGKTYRIRWGMDVSTTVANDLARARIREDNLTGTIRQLKHIKLTDANQDFGATLEFDWTAASTATKTFVGTVVRHLGSGTFSANASANEPTWFTAELVV